MDSTSDKGGQSGRGGSSGSQSGGVSGERYTSGQGSIYSSESETPIATAERMGRAGVERAKEGVKEGVERAKDSASQVAHRVSDAAQFVTHKAEDAFENAKQYLHEDGLKNLTNDLTNLVRRNPIPALLCGVAIGFIVGQAGGRRSHPHG